MDIQELIQIAYRTTIVYFICLFVVRILGKREIGNFTPFDLIVALIIGEAVDEPIYGDVTILKFAVLVGTVAIWELANSWSSYKFSFIRRLTTPQPSLIIENGRRKKTQMASERMSDDELESLLREHSVDDIHEVKQAFLESNGSLSVIKEDWAKPIQKKDLQDEKAES